MLERQTALHLSKKATNILLVLDKATYELTLMNSILDQIKQRRLTLGLKQNSMMLRVGVSRQQYQRLESKGNPRLDTLELIAKGLNSELMLIPKEKLGAVMALLEQERSELGNNGNPLRYSPRMQSFALAQRLVHRCLKPLRQDPQKLE
jgi:transcriptional regulator with XRE-family HTH domain